MNGYKFFVASMIVLVLGVVLRVSQADPQLEMTQTVPKWEIPDTTQLVSDRKENFGEILLEHPANVENLAQKPIRGEGKNPILISVLTDEGVVNMDLESYILGVVLAEMPAHFESEALKAQAVAARTYTLKNGMSGFKHGQGVVCTRSSCCQAYKSPEEYVSSGGKLSAVSKMEKAVRDTNGEVLLYDGKLIDAAYFSCSGGSTEDALEVWGYDVPYLQSVPSPGEEDAAAFYREIQLSKQDFFEKLGLDMPKDGRIRLEEILYTSGGGVAEIRVNGTLYTGAKFRSLLGLRSTLFTIELNKDGALVKTWGYGHRVGMSQYGADAMAAEGAGYDEILRHYYIGAELSQYENS